MCKGERRLDVPGHDEVGRFDDVDNAGPRRPICHAHDVQEAVARSFRFCRAGRNSTITHHGMPRRFRHMRKNICREPDTVP